MRLLPYFIAIIAAANFLVPAFAQEPEPPASLPKSAESLRTLWHQEQQRRVLLAALPEEFDDDEESKQPSPHSIAEWLKKSGTVAHSFGGMTAIASGKTGVMDTNLGPPNLMVTGSFYTDRRTASTQLLASLSASQWQQVASAQGLGVGSLSADQKTFWESCVPNPFVVERSIGNSEEKITPENVRTLTSAERYQVRLRVKLMGSAYAPRASNGERSVVISRKNLYERRQNGETSLDVRDPEDTDSDDTDTKMFGQTIYHQEPNHPKRLPEEFEAQLSTAPVDVAEIGKKPITAGEILTRIETASGLKIFAGAAFRKTPCVVLNSGSVAADDLLRALLFATGNTIRILPPAHTGEPSLSVIASQSEPSGRIIGRWKDWYASAQTGVQDMEEDAATRIALQNPLPLLRFDTDDPLPLSDDLKKRVFAAAQASMDKPNDDPERFVRVPFGQLPPSAQSAINTRARRFVQQSGTDGDYRVRTDMIQVTCGAALSYIVPGSGNLSGEIEATPLPSIATWLPLLESNATISLQGRVVILSADSAEEMQNLVRAAREAQTKEIWVQAPPDIIAAAVQSSGDTPVRGVVSLLHVDRDTPLALPRDENIFGSRSREWLLADDPEVVKGATERVRSVAAIPGIAGIVVRDGVPPGYRGENEAKEEDPVLTGEEGVSYSDSGQQLGYTLAHRRAYVQKSGSDPADGSEMQDSDKDEYLTWLRSLLAPLWHSVREAAGDKSLLVEGEAGFREDRRPAISQMKTFVVWAADAPEPPFAALFRSSDMGNGIATPNLTAKPATFAVIVGNPASRSTPEKLLQLLKREDKPELTIWDLSDKRVPGVRERLRNFLSRAKTP